MRYKYTSLTDESQCLTYDGDSGTISTRFDNFSPRATYESFGQPCPNGHPSYFFEVREDLRHSGILVQLEGTTPPPRTLDAKKIYDLFFNLEKATGPEELLGRVAVEGEVHERAGRGGHTRFGVLWSAVLGMVDELTGVDREKLKEALRVTMPVEDAVLEAESPEEFRDRLGEVFDGLLGGDPALGRGRVREFVTRYGGEFQPRPAGGRPNLSDLGEEQWVEAYNQLTGFRASPLSGPGKISANLVPAVTPSQVLQRLERLAADSKLGLVVETPDQITSHYARKGIPAGEILHAVKDLVASGKLGLVPPNFFYAPFPPPTESVGGLAASLEALGADPDVVGVHLKNLELGFGEQFKHRPTLARVLGWIRQRGATTRGELCKHFSLPERTSAEILAELEGDGRVVGLVAYEIAKESKVPLWVERGRRKAIKREIGKYFGRRPWKLLDGDYLNSIAGLRDKYGALCSANRHREGLDVLREIARLARSQSDEETVAEALEAARKSVGVVVGGALEGGPKTTRELAKVLGCSFDETEYYLRLVDEAIPSDVHPRGKGIGSHSWLSSRRVGSIVEKLLPLTRTGGVAIGGERENVYRLLREGGVKFLPGEVEQAIHLLERRDV
ncbi:MAG: hypothetical protein ACTSU5_14770 [Promethearchaeota archaeon]